MWGGRPRPRPTPWPDIRISFNFNKPGEGARRGSGDPPHQFYAEVGKWEPAIETRKGEQR
jgi:hypothetical protein